jgi:hypothetical protein
VAVTYGRPDTWLRAHRLARPEPEETGISEYWRE